MFCPKCGWQTLESVKFCRQCGTDLSAIGDALSGNLSVTEKVSPKKSGKSVEDLTSEAIKQIFAGAAFLFISIILLTTNIVGGKEWWFWLLIPAFGAIGNGIGSFVKANMLKKKQLNPANTAFSSSNPTAVNEPQNPLFTANSAPSAREEFFKSEISRYQTGELVAPPSVTEHTTRHLDLASESKTQHFSDRDKN